VCGVWFIAVDAQVRAMDVVQEWSVAVLGERVEEFMVFGASKRGECTVVAAH
jgi:PhoPQ-activated pathogenicity-related protein